MYTEMTNVIKWITIKNISKNGKRDKREKQ